MIRRNTTFLFCAFFLSSSAYADVIGKIEQISADKSRVLVKTNAGTKIGQSDKLSLSDDCDVELLKIKGDKAIMSTKSCLNLSMIQVGNVVNTEAGAEHERATTAQSTPPLSNSSSTKRRGPILYNSDKILSGFTIAGSLASHSGKVKGSYMGESATYSSSNNSEALGLRLGYADINDGNIGFMTRMTVATKVSNSTWNNYSYLRPDINATIGGADFVYGFGGINLTKFMAPSDSSKLNPALGLQLGVGFKVMSQSFFEVQYAQSKTSGDINGIDIDLDLSGLELAFGYNF